MKKVFDGVAKFHDDGKISVTFTQNEIEKEKFLSHEKGNGDNEVFYEWK